MEGKVTIIRKESFGYAIRIQTSNAKSIDYIINPVKLEEVYGKNCLSLLQSMSRSEIEKIITSDMVKGVATLESI